MLLDFRSIRPVKFSVLNFNDVIYRCPSDGGGMTGTVTLNPRYLMLPEALIHGVALGNSTSSKYRLMGSASVAGIEAGWVDPVKF